MFQRVTLIGHVGADAQMRYTPDGTPVTSFNLATKSSVSKARTPDCPAGWRDSYNGRNWELTTWWRVTCWRQLAEMVSQYVTKGMLLFVEGEIAGTPAEGKLNPRLWTGNDGVTRASFEITARTVKFMSGRGEGGAAAAAPPGEETIDLDDVGDLPF